MRCGCECSLFLLFLVRLLAGLFFSGGSRCFLALLMLLFVCLCLMKVFRMCWWCHWVNGSNLEEKKSKKEKRRKKRERNGKSERKKRGGYWGSRIGFGESWCIHGLFLTHSGRCLENEASHILTWVKLDWWLETWFSCSPLWWKWSKLARTIEYVFRWNYPPGN